MLLNSDRYAMRHVFFTAWKKAQSGEAMSGLEKKIIGILSHHPEYQRILNAPERFQDQDWMPEHGQTNPFLHMGLHLSLEEQCDIDQPFGVRTLYQQAIHFYRDAHKAQHEMMECLAGMIWLAQRQHSEPDTQMYLSCIRNKIGLTD